MITTPRNNDEYEHISSPETEEPTLSESSFLPPFLTRHWFLSIALIFGVVLLGGILIGRTMTLHSPPFLQIEGLTERIKKLEKKSDQHFLPTSTLFSTPRYYLVVLRQDVLSGFPFKESLKRFQEVLPLSLKERCQKIFSNFPSQRVKSFEGLILTFHPSFFRDATDQQEGFWKGVWRFFQGILTIETRTLKTPENTTSYPRSYGELYEALEAGRLEETLTILENSKVSLTAEGQQWAEEARRFLKMKKMLSQLEVILSGKG